MTERKYKSCVHRQRWQTKNIANNIDKDYENRDNRQLTTAHNNYTGVIIVISYSCSEADQLCRNPFDRHFTKFKMFTNCFLGRNDIPAQFSCSLMHLSSRTLLILSAVITARGTPMRTLSPRPTDSRHKNSNRAYTRDVSMKLWHPWTLQHDCDKL